MSFQKFRKLSTRPLLLLPSRKREGSQADRGQEVHWPGMTPAGAAAKAQAALQALKDGRARGFLRRITPGLVTGAADADPSLVLTATVAGAIFGYSLLWVVLLCVPLLLAVFTVTARIGHQTRRGLVHLLREHYGPPIAMGCAAVIVIINFAMIIADLMAVSDALSIILDQQRIFFVAAVAFSVWYILIFGDYHKITHALAFISLPLFVYVVAAVMAKPPLGQVVVNTLVPRITGNPHYTEAIVAIFGSLLTPYILVWQTSSRREQASAGAELHASEHRTGTFVTTILCFSIMVAAARVLKPTLANATSLEWTTRTAAQALTPAAGDWGVVLFAIGIIGSGLVALPVLVASLCYSVSEAMGWKSGLSENPWDARRFYVLISAGLLLAGALNFVDINPLKALYWSQFLAGVLTVPILIFILILSNDRRVMRQVNTRWQNFWIGAAVGALAALGLLLLWLKISAKLFTAAV